MNLEFLFEPKSIAIIGPTPDPTDRGQRMIKAIVDQGFPGDVFLISNKDETSVFRTYSNLNDIPKEIDLCLLSVRDGLQSTSLAQCTEKHVKCLGLIGTPPENDRSKTKDELDRILKETDMRILGPGSNGIISNQGRLCGVLFSLPRFEEDCIRRVGVITQSGAVGESIVSDLGERGIAINKYVCTGKEKDVSSAELVEYFAQDDSINVISIYVEGLNKGRVLLSAVQSATSKKPVVILKGGRTQAGSEAAYLHVDALATQYKIFDALFKQAGATVVESITELVDITSAFAQEPLPDGRKVAIITRGGGLGVLASDQCTMNGLELPNLKAAFSEIPALSGGGTKISNPIDTDGVSEELYRKCQEIAAQNEEIDALIIVGIPNTISEFGIVNHGKQMREVHKKPIFYIPMRWGWLGEYSSKILNSGLFRSPDAVARGLSALVKYQEYVKKHRSMDE